MSAPDRSSFGTDWLTSDVALAAGRLRVRQAASVTDFFLPAEARLRDDDRAAVAQLLAGLVDAIDQDVRGHLVAAIDPGSPLAQIFSAPAITIARPILERTNLLGDPAVIAVLARRGREARMMARLRYAAARTRALDPAAADDPIERLAAGAGKVPSIVTQRAAGLLRAERGRIDAGGRPVLAQAELPADLHYRLVWRVAAALREYAVFTRIVEPLVADPLIGRAVNATLGGYDEGESLPAIQTGLALALRDQSGLDGGLIVAALGHGHLGFALAALALNAGIGFEAAWDMAFEQDGAGLLLLCRAADIAPADAASFVLALDVTRDDEMLAAQVEGYARIPSQQAAAAVAVFRLDPTYLESIADLAANRAW